MAGHLRIYFLMSNRSLADTHAKVHLGRYRTMWVETNSLSAIHVRPLSLPGPSTPPSAQP